MEGSESFFSLVPDRVLDSVERSLGLVERGLRATGRTIVLNSIENRVYEVELEDGTSVVAKFYRPGRWSPEQILEEHDFLARLVAAEVPTVAPFDFEANVVASVDFPVRRSLSSTEDGILFAVFPKLRGRLRDELKPDELRQLGRFLARLHNVGSTTPFRHRLTLDVETFGWDALDYLDDSGFLGESRDRYLDVAERVLRGIAPRLEGFPAQSVHGDCHIGNVLWNEFGPFFVDFDDMVTAPVVQDVWMIVRGRDDDARRDRDYLLEGYEEMRPFPWVQLALIEPLRALRLIHYSAWIARRWSDPSFPRTFPHLDGENSREKYWFDEIQALTQILAFLEHE